MKKLAKYIGLVMVMLLAVPTHAALTIQITEGVEGAVPVAIVPFAWEGPGESQANDVAKIIASDLARSGRFKVLPRADMLAKPTRAADVKFRNWSLLGVENLVIGRIRVDAKGNASVQFRLFDVFRQEQQAGKEMQVPNDDFRSLAHRISDLIYQKITGEQGVFATRVAYVVAGKQVNGKPRYALQVSDADGFNAATIVNQEEPLLSPAWSPDGKRIAYVSYEGKRPGIYIQDLATGGRQKIASFKGINSAPAWAPDSRRLAMTLSKGVNPDIYVYDLASRRFTRLTKHYGIDTEPAWSPDGRSLVFTSDRGGKPQIYRVSAAGGSAHRVTFEGDYNARAQFSPDGELLTLIHQENGQFRVAVLELDNGALRVLTDGGLDESPSFAPNGRMVIYASQGKNGAALETVSVDGRVRQRIGHTAGGVREPAWGPFRN